MKKLFILSVLVLLLGSCTCIMSQSIPPQYLYVDESCGAPLPDYLPMFTFSDNCAIDTVLQSPTRGTWLTVPTTTVLIRAIDNFSNHTDLIFTVTLLDTVPPTITLGDSTLITNGWGMINSMYDVADKMIARQEIYFDNTFPYDIIRVSYIDSLENENWIIGIPDTIQPTNLYANKIMLRWVSPGHALTGEGGSWITFQEPGDTLIVQ
jgi:hypothetical protein